MTQQLTVSADARLDANWWRQAVVYQVYPRSFADSNGDGIGDLAGLTSRVPYLAGLGIDAIWLSPFYPSALADGGYDVADHRDVHPQLGTLDDFDDLVEASHYAGLRVIVDIVPNHTSNLHPWFAEALASEPGSASRARYIFRDGTGPDGSEPPSDWVSHFGGPAWTRIPDGQWYCHLFAREQPDLNWDNREVRDDFLTTLRFWADRGVDGFRVDVAHALAKDLSEPLRSKPVLEDENMPLDGSDPLYDRNEVHEIYAEWRQLFDSYDPPRTAVAEACAPSERRALYARPSGLGQAFNFDLLKADYSAAAFHDAITFCLDEAAKTGSSSTWVLSNHDVVRHATRYALPAGLDLDAWLMSDGALPVADEARGLRRARAAILLMLALPGSSYLYQGEELGLHEVADLPPDVAAGSDLGADAQRQEGPRRLPGAAALVGRRRLVRLRRGPRLVAATRRLLAIGGGRPAEPARFDAGAVPGGAAGPANPADRRGARAGSRPATRMCCTSSGRAGGTASATSAPIRCRCPTGSSGSAVCRTRLACSRARARSGSRSGPPRADPAQRSVRVRSFGSATNSLLPFFNPVTIRSSTSSMSWPGGIRGGSPANGRSARPVSMCGGRASRTVILSRRSSRRIAVR